MCSNYYELVHKHPTHLANSVLVARTEVSLSRPSQHAITAQIQPVILSEAFFFK